MQLSLRFNFKTRNYQADFYSAVISVVPDAIKLCNQFIIIYIMWFIYYIIHTRIYIL